MTETRKLAAILVADVVGYSRLTGVDEDRILARLRTLRSDLIDPTIAVYHGRVVKRTGDGAIVEFRSAVDAVNFAVEIQRAMVERNAEVAPDKRIEFRVGIHVGDVVEESDGDLMGDGVNIAARLQSIARPGAICLSEQAYWQVKGRLELAVTDLGNTALKNIAEPIHAYSVEVGKPTQAKPAPSATSADQAKEVASKRHMPSAPLAAAIAALLLLIAAGGWFVLDRRNVKPSEPAHLSIVVLPFTNLSGDPSQDYFADGVTENLTTELSRIRNGFVIARNTAFTYKGKSIDAKQIGKELGVRYMLEGSVQRDQNRVRVNAQLIDAESGAHLWADRFGEDVSDLFKLQDDVVARLANTLGYELVRAEAARGAQSKNPDAMDLTMRGRAIMARLPPTRDSNEAARALFEQALKIDPEDPDALAGSAATYASDFRYGWRSSEIDFEAKIIGQADRAISLAPNATSAFLSKASYFLLNHRWNEALSVANAGLAINPNSAALHAPRGVAENSLGRFEQAKSDLELAMRLSPRDPGIGFWHVQLGDVSLNLGQFDVAIDEYLHAIDAGFRTWIPYANLAAVYALQGKKEQSQAELAEALRFKPDLTVKWIVAHAPNLQKNVEGLRKAGLPEE
jgi:adenylate cyclase